MSRRTNLETDDRLRFACRGTRNFVAKVVVDFRSSRMTMVRAKNEEQTEWSLTY